MYKLLWQHRRFSSYGQFRQSLRYVSKHIFTEIAQTYAFHTWFMCSSMLDIKDEVQEAIINKRAVVALESTIITHGMPHPQNLKTAIDVENIVREQVKKLK